MKFNEEIVYRMKRARDYLASKIGNHDLHVEEFDKDDLIIELGELVGLLGFKIVSVD